MWGCRVFSKPTGETDVRTGLETAALHVASALPRSPGPRRNAGEAGAEQEEEATAWLGAGQGYHSP